MSAERLRSSLVARTAVFLVLTEVLEGAGSVLMAAGKTAEAVASAFYYLEVDAARRYRDLTGFDLARADGTDRYEEKKDNVFSEPGIDVEDDE